MFRTGGHAVTTGRGAQDAGERPAMHRTALQQRISRPPNTRVVVLRLGNPGVNTSKNSKLWALSRAM